MGATDFIEKGRGTNADKVFKELTRNARNYYGNDPYGGHIGTKDGFVMHTKKVVTLNEAYRMAEEAMNRPGPVEYGKWDDAGAIAFGEEKVVASKEFEVTVKARSENEARMLVQEKMKGGRKRAGAEIEVKFTSTKKTAEAGKRKLTRTKPSGESYYTILNAGSKQRYSTLKEATAALRAYLLKTNHTWSAPVEGKEYVITKVQDFGSISFQESSKLPTYTVKGVRQQVKVGKVKGYLFFGMAPS